MFQPFWTLYQEIIWHEAPRAYTRSTLNFFGVESVDETKISAKYEQGVLTITLPKLPETEAKSKIPIQ